ncbi:unnamed protein product [Rhizophagus irregularis]|uniref:Uncharacterized protein n=1 Tax=Rhizophagus irregularis TaxID=588596 RepID=A0A2N1MFF4_9GLOM|nr:hypothetical protein RhiirC2_793390 [Rhizophagus irregularis]CAB4391351.1 unnamed protein product [Rhizophagus irregularis]CAB5378409.1 unnamed protein product [Rhizophagus irregularis]
MNNDTHHSQVTYTTSEISTDHNQYENIPQHDSYQQPGMPNAASSNNDNHQQYDTLNINQQPTTDNILPQCQPQHVNQNTPQSCLIFHNNSQKTVIFSNHSTNNSILLQPPACLNCSSINNSQTQSQYKQ